MLKSIHGMIESLKKEKAGKKVTAWVIFAIIVIVFVFFGMPQRMGYMAGGTAATVNNSIITVADWQQQVEYLEKLNAYFSGKDAQSRVRRMALERLVYSEVIVQAAQNAGILATDSEVQDAIIGFGAFQKDGRFQRELYDRYLTYSRMSAGEFEGKIRRDLIQNKVRRLFMDGVALTNLENEKEKLLGRKKINLNFAKVDLADVQPKIDDAIVADQLKNPEFAKQAEEYYQSHLNDYSQKERVHAQHILIAAGKNAQESEDKAKAIVKRLEKEDFAKVAKEVSEDPGSKPKGGDLGFFTRGQMVPQFEDAAFGAEVGKVVGPVKSDFGYHVIKVLEHQQAKVSTFEESKKQVAAQLLKERTFKELVAKLEAALEKSDKAQIEQVTKDLGVKWEETGLFAMDAETVPKIGENEDVFEKAYELTQKGDYAKRLVSGLGATRYIISLKDLQDDAAAVTAKNKAFDASQQTRSNALFDNWIKIARDSAKVSFNHKLFSAEID